MVKTALFLSLIATTYTLAKEPSAKLEKNCLSCHVKQEIPSELVYRRYLLKYSTNFAIKERLFSYLKNPNKKNSIMPKQFFLKFPKKEASDMNETALLESIDDYLDYFDVRKRLILPKK